MKLSLTSLSIKQKLISTMALSSLALCGGFGYALVDKFEDAETKNLYNVEIPSVMNAVDTKVENEINQLIYASEFLAKNPFVEKEFNSGVSQETEVMLETMLKNIAQQYGFTDTSLINSHSNKYWNQNGFLKVLTPEEDSWYFQRQGAKHGVEVSTFRETDGTAKVFVNYRNTDKGVISATSKTLQEIEEFLGDFSITDGTKVYLADSDGVVKVHPDRKHIDKSNIESLYQTTAKSLFSKTESKITTLEVSDEDKIIATSYIDALGWYVVVDIPKDEVFALVDDAKTSMILITALVALLATLFSVFVANSIVRPIDRLTKVFKDIGSGEGDLTTRIPVKGDDEIAALSSGFNSFIESIHSSVKMVAETSAQLATAASSVDGHSKKTLDLCDHQSDITTHTVTAINEMGATVNEIASNASVAAEQAAEAESQSSEGEKIVISTKETANKLSEEITGISARMDTLAENTNSIESILDVIRGISEQTNLLALNAAIEAARAGEHGRGFAVVADEVRTLASRTNSSIDDIQGMISSLQKEASLAVESIEAGRETTLESTASSEAAREAISTIAKSISEISSVNYQVAAATEEQSTVVDELNRKVDEINQITQDNRNTASELSQSSSELRELSTKLNELVNRFKI